MELVKSIAVSRWTKADLGMNIKVKDAVCLCFDQREGIRNEYNSNKVSEC